jgi:hypothetical protein
MSVLTIAVTTILNVRHTKSPRFERNSVRVLSLTVASWMNCVEQTCTMMHSQSHTMAILGRSTIFVWADCQDSLSIGQRSMRHGASLLSYCRSLQSSSTTLSKSNFLLFFFFRFSFFVFRFSFFVFRFPFFVFRFSFFGFLLIRSRYRLVPQGSFSRIERLDKTSFELYGSNDIGFGKLFWYRRFGNAMNAFLQCVKELCDHATVVDRNFKIPHRIENESIGEMNLKLQLNNEETWTKGLKYLLTDIKWLLLLINDTAK